MQRSVWSVAIWPVIGTSASSRQAAYIAVVRAGDRPVEGAKASSDKKGV
jgi:hypothetical protein